MNYFVNKVRKALYVTLSLNAALIVGFVQGTVGLKELTVGAFLATFPTFIAWLAPSDPSDPV